MNIRILKFEDIENYLAQCEVLDAESGNSGTYYGPYSKNDEYPIDELRKLTKERWGKNLDTPGWRRAWGIFDGDKIVGSGDIAAGDLKTNIHRVNLGMGIMKEYRGNGNGKKLLGTIIDWCRSEDSVMWIDLGVFSGNQKSESFFINSGFMIVSTVPDSWRIDSHIINQTNMTLFVG